MDRIGIDLQVALAQTHPDLMWCESSEEAATVMTALDSTFSETDVTETLEGKINTFSWTWQDVKNVRKTIYKSLTFSSKVVELFEKIYPWIQSWGRRNWWQEKILQCLARPNVCTAY